MKESILTFSTYLLQYSTIRHICLRNQIISCLLKHWWLFLLHRKCHWPRDSPGNMTANEWNDIYIHRSSNISAGLTASCKVINPNLYQVDLTTDILTQDAQSRYHMSLNEFDHSCFCHEYWWEWLVFNYGQQAKLVLCVIQEFAYNLLKDFFDLLLYHFLQFNSIQEHSLFASYPFTCIEILKCNNFYLSICYNTGMAENNCNPGTCVGHVL